jgi:hypothetical protein
MALYSGAVKKLINPGSNDPAIIPIGVILHVDAGNSGSLYSYFKDRSGGIESHFHIPKSGKPEQYRDTSREADANYKGNSFLKDGKRYGFISVETQGLERGGWTPSQINEIKKLLAWASRTHRFPLRKCPAWNAPGVGYHVLFGAPGAWTPVSKSCPGPDRIRQFNNVLVPWFRTATAPAPTPKPPVSTGDDMALTEADLDAVEQRAYLGGMRANREYGRLLWGEGGTAGEFMQRTDASMEEADLQLDRIEDDTDDDAAPAATKEA